VCGDEAAALLLGGGRDGSGADRVFREFEPEQYSGQLLLASIGRNPSFIREEWELAVRGRGGVGADPKRFERKLSGLTRCKEAAGKRQVQPGRV